MDETNVSEPNYQFETKLKAGKFEIVTVGGLVRGIGAAVIVEESPYYYGLFAIRLMFLFLFLDVTFFWDEPTK